MGKINFRSAIFLFFIFNVFNTIQAQKNIPPKAVKCFEAAEKALIKNNINKAIVNYEKAVKIAPNYTDAWARMAQIYEGQNKIDMAIKMYQNSIKNDSFYLPTYYYFSKFLYEQNKVNEADYYLKNMIAKKENNAKLKISNETLKKAKILAGNIEETKKDNTKIADLHIKNMGPNINTKGPDYWPGMTIDGKHFIFTRLIFKGYDKDSIPYGGQEDFYISDNVDGIWQKAYTIPGEINTPMNEGTSSVTANGKVIFYTMCNLPDGKGSCDLYYSITDGVNWGPRKNMSAKINTEDWEGQPSIGPDLRTIIFASVREGGFGGFDLYQTTYTKDGWTKPENLGDSINTIDADQAPFLSYDGKTLYFSSTGHGGRGGSDIFMSRLHANGKWGKPVNMGIGINTPAEEFGFYVDRKGEKGYFVSDRKGGLGSLDMYECVMPINKKPQKVTYVQGKIFDLETKKPVAAKIELLNQTDNKLIFTDSVYDFFTTLFAKNEVACIALAKGYMPYSERFTPTESSVDSPYVINVFLKPIKENTSIVLRNILFDIGKFDLKEESFFELNKLIGILNANPSMQIEISGHTDNTAGDDINIPLSKNRAQSVVNYLIGKGISKSRLSFAGYGSKQPIADNKTDAGKSLNRRIEVKIVKVN